MIRPEFKEALIKQHQVLVVLWTFFFCALFIYLWISEFVLARPGLSGGSDVYSPTRIALWLLVVFDLGTLAWWRRRFLTREGILAEPGRYKILQALQGHTSPLEERAAGAISSYVTSKIVAYAIIEAIAIYGFVLAFVGHHTRDQYLFSLISALLLVREFPSKARLQGLVSEIEARGSPALSEASGRAPENWPI